MKFIRKPTVVEAIQWLGTNLKEVTQFIDGHPVDTSTKNAEDKWGVYETIVKRVGLTIETPYGYNQISIGDWVIRESNNDLYHCSPDVFKANYRKPNEENHATIPEPFDPRVSQRSI